ncbi:hypothetical protein Desaci_3033 [Desulfosporosinus acidiphilus SJ4]|uniref:Uncharacterized protein n=1 Tax=Desulfosporosinus acidiphilus (strain DSM 22704 / JCM 16185 / SJ4) TaxID=646529 RepID=I4D817_DESAJ|nr:hypothetical protein [Desulfosporosinus acidiphilus]AFM41941.1 hypothetical protein Desaci_3033 [Desulfosporosinus acidiphilus SJ4]
MAKKIDNLLSIPEYVNAKNELSQLEAETSKIKSMITDNTKFIIEASGRLEAELEEARKNLISSRAQLVSEEMRGNSTVETSQKVRIATDEVERIESTLQAISHCGGVTIIKIKDKIRKLKLHKFEAECKRTAYRGIVPHRDLIREDEKAIKLSEIEKEINQLSDEISSNENILNKLKSNKERFGALLSADAATQEEARRCLQIAVNTVNTLDRLRSEVIEKRRIKKKEIDQIKAERDALELAIVDMDSDYTFNILWSSDVFHVLWPELFSNAHPHDMGNIRNLAKIKFRNVVRKGLA